MKGRHLTLVILHHAAVEPEDLISQDPIPSPEGAMAPNSPKSGVDSIGEVGVETSKGEMLSEAALEELIEDVAHN